MDDNQAEIVRWLRAAGATVQSLAAIGAGVPDLLVGYRRQSFLLEIKDGSKTPSQRRLTPAQVAWHRTWVGLPVAVVECAEDALAAIGAGRLPHPPSRSPRRVERATLARLERTWRR